MPTGQNYSAVLEIELPASFDLLPSGRYPDPTKVYEYTAAVPTDMYSPIVSNAERLPNGNTLIVAGQSGAFREVGPADQVVWEYSSQSLAPGEIVFQVHYEPRTLWSDLAEVSTSAGGTVHFDLVVGSKRGGQAYFLLDSRSGTVPGVQIGNDLLPLNPDSYLLYTLNNANGPILPGSAGVLDALGKGTADFVLPPGIATALAGTTIHHAFVTIDTSLPLVTTASNALPIDLLP